MLAVISPFWLPFVIFFARIADVTLGTVRIVLVARDMRWLAPLFGFFEVFIWLVVVSQVLTQMNSWVNYVAYAGGFATGNWLGMILENKLAMGTALIRMIVKEKPEVLVSGLRAEGYQVTCIEARGNDGPVTVVNLAAPRKESRDILHILGKTMPDAIYTVEEVKGFNAKALPPYKGNTLTDPLPLLRQMVFNKKSK